VGHDSIIGTDRKTMTSSLMPLQPCSAFHILNDADTVFREVFLRMLPTVSLEAAAGASGLPGLPDSPALLVGLRQRNDLLLVFEDQHRAVFFMDTHPERIAVGLGVRIVLLLRVAEPRLSGLGTLATIFFIVKGFRCMKHRRDEQYCRQEQKREVKPGEDRKGPDGMIIYNTY